MCPLLEANGETFNPVKQVFLTFDEEHLKKGLNDDCCYYDVEILEVHEQFIKCKIIKENENFVNMELLQFLIGFIYVFTLCVISYMEI